MGPNGNSIENDTTYYGGNAPYYKTIAEEIAELKKAEAVIRKEELEFEVCQYPEKINKFQERVSHRQRITKTKHKKPHMTRRII